MGFWNGYFPRCLQVVDKKESSHVRGQRIFELLKLTGVNEGERWVHSVVRAIIISRGDISLHVSFVFSSVESFNSVADLPVNLDISISAFTMGHLIHLSI